MDFKSLLSQLDQLKEATEKTKTGIKHTAEPGGYGRKDDEDEEGNKVKTASTEKKGRGRPKKATQSSGEDKKYDFSAFGVKTGKDIKLPKHDKKKTTKHSLKEYLDQLDSALNEADQIQIKPASQMPKKPGQTSQPGQQQQAQGQAPQNAQNTQVIAQGNKTLGTVNNPQLAQQIKQSIGKGEMTLNPDQEMAEGQFDVDVSMNPIDLSSKPSFKDIVQRYTQLVYQGHAGETSDEESQEYDAIEQYVAKRFGEKGSAHLQKAGETSYWGRDDGRGSGGHRSSNLGSASKPVGDFRTTKAGVMNKQDAKSMKDRVADRLGRHPEPNLPEGDIGKHNNATTGFDALVRKLTPKYGVEAAKRIAGAQMKKIKEADQPTHDGDMGAGLGAGRNQGMLEGKKPDFLDLDKDGNKKEPMKNAAQDKKKVKEGMEHKLKAARHAGKSHALSKQGYNCSYDDMEESKHYHEGYKEGLDECYGQMPIQGYVGEANPPATVPGMASQAMQEPTMEDDMYEMDKTAYMKQQAMKTPGDTFKAFGQTFKDKEVLESPFAFEALEQQLNALLESKEDVAEGMTVSISKGNQGSPDSVSVSAQDSEAEQLLGLIKSAGLGLFGGDDAGGYGAPQGGQPQHGGLDVVGDHDGMMALIKKVTGGEAGNGDYADEVGPEEHGHDHEEGCNECGMAYESCGCDDKEMVDEVESEDQMTYQMAEDNPPDSGADNTNAAIADTAQANAAGAAYNPRNDVDEGAGGPEASEEPVEELTPEEEDQSDEEGEEEKSAEEEDKADKESMSESMFVNLYKKLTLISEESTSEKDDKAEKAAKKVAKDIEYDEDHKGKDDDKAEEAGKKVKKDIEYDDKKDKKKIDEWANDAGPGKSASDTAFETDIDFMMNVISGGLNKRKQTGQTTIPVLSSQLGRQVSRKTTDINESKYSSDDAVAQWKKLAGLK
jgi:hypothetical protein